MTGISSVSNSGMTAIRWFSMVNPEMDCIVYVSNDQIDLAIKTIRQAIDEWWDEDGGLCYGDAIIIALDEVEIPYVMMFPEWNKGGMSCVSEWDEWANSVEALIV